MVEARLAELGGDGPPLLLIHGFGSDSLSWSGLVGGLSRSHRLLAVDLPGHGKAPDEVGDGSIETLAGAVVDSLGAVDRPVAVVGHSLGGAVAAALHGRAPGLVSSLVLIAPVGLGHGVDRDFLTAFPAVDGEDALRALLLRLVTREALIQPPLLAHVLAGLARPGRREALSRIAAGVLDAPPMVLPADVPTDVIWGDEDRINRFDTALEARWPGRVHRLAGVGHLPHVEAAAPVARLIRTLLAPAG